MNGSRGLHIHDLVNGNGPPPAVYRFLENAREYYAYRNTVVYPFPIDEDEQRRLDQFHFLIHELALNHRLYTADLSIRSRRPQVLDVGHGTGIWVYEMAEAYPDMDVYGIDLIDSQATLKDPMSNAFFTTQVDFTSDNWGFRPNSFDLIRMSQLCGSVPDWARQYELVFNYLRPGTGFIEHVEIDWTPHCSDKKGFPPQLDVLKQWWRAMEQASAQNLRPIAYREDTGDLLSNTGFVDLTHKTIRIAFNLPSRNKDERDALLKRHFQSFMCTTDPNDGGTNYSFESLSMSLLYRQLSIPPHRIESMCETLRRIYHSDCWPIYHNIHIWTARKPSS